MAVGISSLQNLILIILFTIIIVFFIGGNETNIAESVVFIFVAVQAPFPIDVIPTKFKPDNCLFTVDQSIDKLFSFLQKKMKLLILAPPRLTLREYFLKT